MKEYLEDCYSLDDLRPQTVRCYIDLDNAAFIYNTMISDEFYNYFKEDKNRIFEFLKDGRVAENTLTDGILCEQYYEVKYNNELYILKYKENSFRRQVIDDYNIEITYDVIPDLCAVQGEFPYKWLQVGFIIERFDICIEDLEELK
jgi:hypothetical protein